MWGRSKKKEAGNKGTKRKRGKSEDIDNLNDTRRFRFQCLTGFATTLADGACSTTNGAPLFLLSFSVVGRATCPPAAHVHGGTGHDQDDAVKFLAWWFLDDLVVVFASAFVLRSILSKVFTDLLESRDNSVYSYTPARV
jgi:hypothetical protein